MIIDYVCTTGETLKAVHHLLTKAGVDHRKIVEAIVLFTEGEERTEVKFNHENNLKVHIFEHIPILPNNPSIDNTLFSLYSECDLPTSYGTLKFCVFKHRTLGVEAIACVSPLTFMDGKKQHIPVRVHDACITSESFHSIKVSVKITRIDMVYSSPW